MKKIEIKFCDTEGNLLYIAEKDINKKFDEEIPVAPIVDYNETRRFLKWSEDVDSLQKDTIVTAVFENITPYKFEEIDGRLYLVDTDSRCMHTFYDIPSEYAGEKVHGIMPGAFKNVSANAATIYIPKGIKDIRSGAFDSCYNTTLLFEAKKPNLKPDICNFEPNMYFGVTEDNHFLDDEYEYLLVKGGAIVLRCLDAYIATIINDHVHFNGKSYKVIGLNPYIFYSPFCVDLVEMYLPKHLSIEHVLPDYIFNCQVIPY